MSRVRMRDYPYNLFVEAYGELERDRLPEDFEGTAEYILCTALTHLERSVLFLRYKEGYTFRDIGSRLSITPSNTRQTAINAIRRLRVSDYGILLRCGLKQYISTCKDAAYREGLSSAESIYKKDNEGLSLAEVQRDHAYGGLSACDIMTPIEELGLLPRSFNTLKRADINTVGDVLRHSISGLLKVDGIGTCTLEDIIVRIQAKGYRFSRSDAQHIDYSA